MAGPEVDDLQAAGVRAVSQHHETVAGPDLVAGVLLYRGVLESVGAGQDPDRELVADHLTGSLVYATPDWSLEDAAAAMVRGGFRHLVVIEEGEIVGLLSMRDVVRCWTQEGATSDMPA